MSPQGKLLWDPATQLTNTSNWPRGGLRTVASESTALASQEGQLRAEEKIFKYTIFKCERIWVNSLLINHGVAFDRTNYVSVPRCVGVGLLFLEIGSLNYVGRGTWIRERLELYVFGVVFKFEVLTSQLWGQKVFRAFFSSGICIQVLAVLFGFVWLVFFFLVLAAFCSFERQVFELWQWLELATRL